MHIKLFVTITGLLISFQVIGSTKHLQCTQTNDENVTQVINAVISDGSEKAEVQLYATTAKCASTESCSTDLFEKIVLPTIIRLTYLDVSTLTGTTISHVIDIDRKDLRVVTRSSFKTEIGNSDDTFLGHCKIKKVYKSENLL